MWSSIAVLIGLGGVALGYPWADSAAALIVAVVHPDRRLAARPPHHRDADRHGAGRRERRASREIARRVGGVVAVERVRVRSVGPTLFVDLIVAVSRTLPLDRVAAIKTAVDAAIRAETAGGRGRRRDRAARARRRDRAGARHGDRAQPRARGPPRHRARDRRAAVDLARPGGGRQAFARQRARDRRRAGGGGARRARPRGRGRDPHRAAADRAGSRGATRRTSGSRRCATR